MVNGFKVLVITRFYCTHDICVCGNWLNVCNRDTHNFMNAFHVTGIYLQTVAVPWGGGGVS